MFEAVDQVSNKLYEGDIYLIVYGAEKEEYFRSEYWPGRLTLDSFPEVEGELRGMRVSESDFNPERWLDSRRRRGNPQFGPGPGPRFEGKPPDEIRRGGGERGRFQVPEPILFTRSSRDGPIRFGVFQFPGFNVTLGVELGGVAKEMEHARNAFIFSLPLALAVLAFRCMAYCVAGY